MKFYEKGFIGLSTKSVMSSLSVPQKANLLLTCMEIRVDQYREGFPLICSILEEEAVFEEVTTKMRYDYTTNEGNYPKLFYISAIIVTSINYHEPSNYTI